MSKAERLVNAPEEGRGGVAHPISLQKINNTEHRARNLDNWQMVLYISGEKGRLFSKNIWKTG